MASPPLPLSPARRCLRQDVALHDGRAGLCLADEALAHVIRGPQAQTVTVASGYGSGGVMLDLWMGRCYLQPRFMSA